MRHSASHMKGAGSTPRTWKVTSATFACRNARALQVFGECRALNAEFRLSQASDQLALARAAHRERDDKLAMRLLLQFDKHYTKSLDIPAAWLLHAQVLADRLRQDKVACQ